jgi:hypothetical protein
VQHDLLNLKHFLHHFEVVMLFQQLPFEEPMKTKNNHNQLKENVLLELVQHLQSYR